MGMSRRCADAQIGTGLISGRKAFQRLMAEGVKLLNAIQDVYLCEDVTMA
jgi:class I fructose-bisphosphate aldolase